MTAAPSLKALFTKNEVKARISTLRAAGVAVPADYALACFIADNALCLQRDKAGAAYSYHTSEVSLHHTDSQTKHIIGKLHDVVEDSDWTLDDLRDVGFSERVVAGVDGMTSRPGELYFDFIVRGSQNPDTVDVKLNDLHSNMTVSRNNFLLGEKDRERLNKYILSYSYLVAVKQGEIAPGTPFGAWMRQQEPRLQDWDLLRKYSTAPPPAGPVAFRPQP